MKRFTFFLLTGVLLFLFTGSLNAQTVLRNPEVSVGQLIKVIPSLKDYQAPPGYVPPISRIGDRVVGINEDNEEVQHIQTTSKVQPDPVVQRFAATRNNNPSGFNAPNPGPNAPSVITQNFAGMGYTNVAPADPNMCAGPNNILQMINGSAGSYLKIWDRNGVQQLAQIYMTTLVASAGYSGSGDPVAIYDQFANRFMMTEFARIGGSNINSLIVFVSQTSDPTAGWYVYKFTDVSFFPDYPKYGAWPNVLYASTNDFNSAGTAYLGASVYAMNKTKMIAGDATAEIQRFRLNVNCFPINVSGATAPTTTGTVGHFMYYNDNDFNPNPGAADSIGFVNFSPNFAVPASTTLTFSVQALVTAPFKSVVCGGRNCVPSASGNGYDALSDRIMNRVMLRNFGSYEAIVLNYTVDANAGTGNPAKAGIRWYELRKPTGGSWSIYQQSTYAPDNDWRWMGSININSKGQIGMVFDRSGTTSYASIAFTGRNSGDALNTMSVSEQTIKAGTAYGTFGNRWGDYNDCPLDVVNDSLFWCTSMYGNTAAAWATQVAQFKIGDCDLQSSTQAQSQSGGAGVPEGQQVTYTSTINNTGCAPIANFLITDTLPTNVTYVSSNNGGAYNAGNRVVSWAVNLNAGQTLNYSVTVSINAGSYFATTTSINEPVAGATIPAGWAATSSTGPSNWVSTTLASHSAPNSLYAVDNASAITDFNVAMTSSVGTGATPPTLTFWHNYTCETGWDGGVVEMSTNGGGTWTDLGPYMTVNGYSGSDGNNNPLAGRASFTGTSNGWIQTKLRLLPTGQNVRFRFRMGSDDNTAYPATNPGWYVDDILMQNIAEVNIRSSYFNSTGTRISYKDTFTTILPPAGCTPPSITTQPLAVSTCVGTNASFSISASGSAPVTYQWQESQTGAGGPWNNLNNAGVYSGVTTTTLTLTGVTLAMNNYQYRCIATGPCNPAATSNPAILTVVSTSVGGTVNPASINVCSTTNTGTFTLSGQTGSVIRWESSTVGAGGPFTAIANTTTTLTFNNITQTTWYRAVVQAAGCATANSSVGVANFTGGAGLTIITDNGTTLCQGDPTLMTVVTAPTLLTFANPANLPVPGVGTSGPANPYPSIIAVSGVPVNTPVQSVTLFNISHTWESDMGFVLQSPTNQNVVLMNAINGTENGGFGILNRTYTFSDAAATGLNLAGPTNVSGTYKCSNNNTGTNWPAPGPGTVGGGTNPTLATFTGDPTGNWKLFAYDFAGGDFGNVAGGWNIVFAVPGGPVSGGTFSWAPPTGLNATNTNPVAASPNTTTTYTVTHNNGAGCIRTASITITIKQRPLVTAQPVNTTSCSGTSASFTVAGTGTGLTYQWQESTNGGTTYTNLNNAPPYSGVNTATLTINPVTVAMNNYRYRCVLGGDCPPPINNPAQNVSSAATLTVNGLPNVTVTPTGPICGGVAGINGLALNASGANTYVWSPLAGLYTDATASTAYTGTNLATVYAAPTTLTSYTVTGTSTATGCSATATALVNYTPPAPTVTPNPVTMCLGDPAVKLKSSSSTSTTQQFCSGTISVPVPDNNPAGATSNITVSGFPTTCPVTAMSVTWNMPHTWDGDMVFALKAPNGQILNLDYYLSGTGGAGATTGFVNTTVSSTGVNALSSGTNPYTGTFKADAVITGANGSGGPTGYTPTTTTWSSLYSTPNGTYTLAMYDGGAGDVGTLTSWCLNLTYTCGVPSTPATWSPAGGLFSDAGATTPYVAGTQVDSVWTRPSPGGVYNYQVTVNSLPPAPAVPATNFANNNGFSIVTFNFVNTNSYPVTITDLSSVASVAGASLASVYTKPGAINGSPGAISAANGWTLAAGPTPVTATGAVQPMLTGLNIPVAGGATISMAFQLTTSGGTFNLAYSTIAAGNYVFSSGGCNIVTGTNIGYAGDVAPNVPTFTPRGFIGSVTAKATFPPCTSPARTVIVTVNTPIALNPNLPVNAVVCTDKTATFSVAVTAGTSPTYQWQESTNGGVSFSAITNGGVYSGATTATLTITAPPVTMNGYQYRCAIAGTAPCGTVFSATRTLTVNPLPTVVITAPYYNLLPGLQPTITSTSNPVAATYTWIRNGAVLTGTSLGIVSGINTGSLQINIDGMGTYSLRVTDVNGCTNTSNIIIIGDSTSGRVFIYPNPNSGQFQVRYNPTHNNVTPRGINVYNAMGQRITNLKYTLGLPFSRMDVDLRPYGAGVYWIEVVDVNDQRLAVGRAEVLR